VISPLLSLVAAALLGAAPGGASGSQRPAPARPAAGTQSVTGKVTFEEKSLFGTSEVKAKNAIVFLEHVDGPPPAPPRVHPKMMQQEKTFLPRLLVVTAGTQVDFDNEDLVFHNVFSLSQGNEFDLGVYRRGVTKAVRFSRPGVVDVFCNIHPDMIASILVLQNAHYAKVAEDGSYRLDVPPGKYTLVAYWDRGVMARQEIEVSGAPVSADFTLVDSGQNRHHLNKYGQQYGRYK
jgi:hypothetical protein